MSSHCKNKGKSEVSISAELYELQKLYWATQLTIYNLQTLGLTGIILHSALNNGRLIYAGHTIATEGLFGGSTLVGKTLTRLMECSDRF